MKMNEFNFTVEYVFYFIYGTGCPAKVQGVPRSYRVSHEGTGCPMKVQGVPRRYRVSHEGTGCPTKLSGKRRLRGSL